MSKSETQLTLQIEEILTEADVEFDYLIETGAGTDKPTTACRDNRVATVNKLTALFQQALTSLKSEMEKKKRTDSTPVDDFDTGFNVAISECQRAIDEWGKK